MRLIPTALLPALGLALLVAAVPTTASAQGTGSIECSSQDGQRSHCSVANIDPESVTMEQKLSNANCYKGESWDADSRGIWVDRGCRARFSYAHGRGGGNAGGHAGRTGSIECASEGGRRQHCAVPGIDPSSVTMGEKLSNANCYKGENWDADASGIWVSNGCRARFDFVAHGGGNGGAAGGSTQRMQQACIKRASTAWSVTEANLEAGSARNLEDGTWEIQVKSKRTTGFCVVDRQGNVRNLTTF